MVRRCAWATASASECDYHDREWGVPLYDDQKLFELLCLEGAQAGLSWRTVLEKREAYRELFYNFAIDECAHMIDAELAVILQNPRIIRNRLKVYAVRKNARAAQQVMAEQGSLSKYLWQFVGGQPQQHAWRASSDVPAQTGQSDAMSKQLKYDGFTFVGSTICYAFMQSSGMVNDHVVDCFRYKVV